MVFSSSEARPLVGIYGIPGQFSHRGPVHEGAAKQAATVKQVGSVAFIVVVLSLHHRRAGIRMDVCGRPK